MTTNELPAAVVPAMIAKLEAEAAKLTAEGREAIARATLAEIKLERERQDDIEQAASDRERHVYRFNGQVDRGSVVGCVSTLALWDRLDPECDIEVIFNSPGGSVIDGMALFDLLSALSLRGGGTHKVTVGSRGYAASMAGILLQAGDVRWLGANSYLMIHEIAAGTGGKIGEIQDAVKFYEAICEQVIDLFVERSEGKVTREEFVKNWERQDWWLFASTALRYGFIDEIR